MSDANEHAGPAPSSPVPLSSAMDAPEPKSNKPKTIKLRPWPKTIMMIPTFIASIACIIVLAMGAELEEDLANAKAGQQATAPQQQQSGQAQPTPAPAEKPKPKLGLHRNLGLIFMFVLAINLLIVFYDIRTTTGMVIGVTIIALVLLGIVLNNQFHVVPFLSGVMFFLAPVMDIKFYLFMAIVLAILLFVAFVATRFYYWEVRTNEVIIHTGLLEKQDRLPTQHVHCEWQIDDVLEFFLMRSGSLIFTFPGRPRPEVLQNVMRVRKRQEELAELLGVIQVVER